MTHSEASGLMETIERNMRVGTSHLALGHDVEVVVIRGEGHVSEDGSAFHRLHRLVLQGPRRTVHSDLEGSATASGFWPVKQSNRFDNRRTQSLVAGRAIQKRKLRHIYPSNWDAGTQTSHGRESESVR